MKTEETNKLIAEFMEFKQCKGIRSESGKYFDYWAKENFSCIEEQEIQIESEWGYGLVEQDLLFAEQLKFHKDWNWLMEVVEKIEGLGYRTLAENECFMITKSKLSSFDVRSKDDYSTIFSDNYEINHYGGSKKENVYNACVTFIEWYNKNAVKS